MKYTEEEKGFKTEQNLNVQSPCALSLNPTYVQNEHGGAGAGPALKNTDCS